MLDAFYDFILRNSWFWRGARYVQIKDAPNSFATCTDEVQPDPRVCEAARELERVLSLAQNFTQAALQTLRGIAANRPQTTTHLIVLISAAAAAMALQTDHYPMQQCVYKWTIRY